VAGEAHEEAFTVSVRVMGAFLPDTLARSSNLGVVCFRTGDRARAADCFRMVRDLKLKLLAPEDRSTLTAESNLAAAMAETVPESETVAAFEKVLAGMERVHSLRKDLHKV
jgi:hypothetical protein